MLQHSICNRRIVLNSRPHGAPSQDNFRLDESAVPAPSDGEVLLRTLYLSLDPYMRTRMNDTASYAPPVAIGEPMIGATVSRVVASKNAGFKAGDLVLAHAGWQDYSLSNGDGLTVLDDIKQPSHALSVLGMTGFTAYWGLLKIGAPQPGETVVVASASGAVGAVVGQIAKLKGARVVGIAGDADKCRYVTEELGFDACLDRHAPDFASRLASVCPDGIDVYFENVGGAILEAVQPLLNVGARVPLCGLISQYNADEAPQVPDHLPGFLQMLLFKRIHIQGFIIGDHYASGFDEFMREMSVWVAQGKVKVHEDFVDGLEHAPQAFLDLLAGRNFGKVVVRVAHD
ncbi:NADPH-dependent curcumin/dihydrocurcumin reductase [Paraburkholderia unamae]|uniref:NADP-dependent oxidoreductase n=1 Tax=Paraburkholderia unamae TaxID=219649 RepID=UPI001CADF787|nr:NADP-dependent oxidoreductase [Paraburkholderia unamae]CAG9259873.1 NADPH-dependent curcumin/dihydrocurcumin reductase [Paraburkholderia unamae]